MAKKDRTFVRGLTSETYGLNEFRRQQLAAPRVRDDSVVVDTGDNAAHSGDSAESRTWWRIGPGDEPFLTQTIQVHFVELPPTERQQRPRPPERGGVLHPRGPRLRDPRRPALRLEAGRPGLRAHRLGAPSLQPLRRDGRRPGDEGQEHVDVHGPDPAGPQRTDRPSRGVRRARGLVPGLDPRRGGPQEGGDRRGRRVGDHAHGPDAGDEQPGADRPPAVLRRRLRGHHAGGRAPASTGRWPTRSSTCWRASGYSLQWEVEAEIAEKYYARIAKEPTRHDFRQGDTIYVPQNTIAQHFAADGDAAAPALGRRTGSSGTSATTTSTTSSRHPARTQAVGELADAPLDHGTRRFGPAVCRWRPPDRKTAQERPRFAVCRFQDRGWGAIMPASRV